MEKKYKAILDQITIDFINLQKSGETDNLNYFTAIGQFYHKMCTNVTNYEDIKDK